VTVTYDRVSELSRFAKARNIGITLLSDKGSKIIRATGLINGANPPNSWAHGVAHPMILVLDGDGAISHRFSKDGYWSRPTVDIVLEALLK
jgi:peroxiredoxin